MGNIEDIDVILEDIKFLINKASKGISNYKFKFKNAFDVKSCPKDSDITENLTVNKLKKLLSKHNLDTKVYLYNEDTMEEKSIVVDSTDLQLKMSSNNSKSITVKELNELLEKCGWNSYIKVNNTHSISSSTTSSHKSNKRVILNLKTLKNKE